jgi:RNA-binding protein
MKHDKKLQKKFRSIGHHLDPVVIVSNGLTESVQAEIDRALSDHELIKIRINTADREAKKSVIGEICEHQKAELVQTIGNIALIYRKALQQKPHLSNICRYPELAS